MIAAFASFYYMPFAPLTAVSLYLLSELLDAFDGHAARALNQGIMINNYSRKILALVYFAHIEMLSKASLLCGIL